MAKKRKSRARGATQPRRPPKQPTYPTPAERERIIAQRDELLQQILPLLFEGPGIKQDQGIARLAQKYGMQELTTVMAAFQRQAIRREFIGEESQLYRIYRQTFARFGGGRRFLPKQEYEDLVGEHGGLLARRQFLSIIRRQPSRRERELYDLTLVGVHLWEDITPPAVPPQPADWNAPAAGDYALPVRDLLTWGWDLDEGRIARSAYNTARWRPATSDLVRLVLDEGLLEGWPGRAASWAPYHALHMLGYLRAHEHAARLLALMDRENDWLFDRLPTVWSHMGPEAEPPLWAYLDDEDHHSDKRALVVMGLKAIAEVHPKRRPEIVAALIERLRQAPATAARMNSYLVFVLNKMEAIEARDAIAEAFAQNRIDTRIMQWNDVSMLQSK